MKYLLILLFSLISFLSYDQKNIPSKVDEIVRSKKSGLELVKVKGGMTTIGNSNVSDLCPHEVYIKDFQIGKYEITQIEWEQIMGNNPSEKHCSDCPVSNVSHSDVLIFLDKVNKLYNMNYRLPSEVEWEYAAKGGQLSNDYQFSGSDRLSKVGWYDDISDGIQSVGTKEPNELGIYDMSGNVSEWCNDLWKPYPNCQTWDCPSCYVFRGGSWNCYEWQCSITKRWMGNNGNPQRDLGFRVAMD